jgi:hypothetical protein
MPFNKRVCYLMFFLICATVCVAQTNYYKVDKTFYEDGYTYQCDVNEKTQRVLLYNIENKLTYVDQIVKSTGKPISCSVGGLFGGAGLYVGGGLVFRQSFARKNPQTRMG